MNTLKIESFFISALIYVALIVSIVKLTVEDIKKADNFAEKIGKEKILNVSLVSMPKAKEEGKALGALTPIPKKISNSGKSKKKKRVKKVKKRIKRAKSKSKTKAKKRSRLTKKSTKKIKSRVKKVKKVNKKIKSSKKVVKNRLRSSQKVKKRVVKSNQKKSKVKSSAELEAELNQLFEEMDREVVKSRKSKGKSQGENGDKREVTKVETQGDKVNRYIARVKALLQNIPRQSNFAGEKVKVKITVYKDGSFDYSFIKRSLNPELNEVIINYLK